MTSEGHADLITRADALFVALSVDAEADISTDTARRRTVMWTDGIDMLHELRDALAGFSEAESISTLPNDERLPLWTPEQVTALNRWQSCGWVHPFTCRHCRDADSYPSTDPHALVATIRGWICLTCDYTQDWCHDLMLAGPPPNPFDSHNGSDQ